MGLFDFFRTAANKRSDPNIVAIKALGRDSSVEEFLKVARKLKADGDPAAASHALRQGVASHGDSRELAFLLAECLLESGQKDEAVRLYQEVSDAWDNDLAVQRDCGRGLIACEAWQDAELQFHMADERFPNDAALHLIQGEVFERSKDKSLAIEFYRMAWDLASSDTEIKSLAARRIQDLGGHVPADGSGSQSDSGPLSDREAMDQNLQKMLDLPDRAFFLLLSRDLIRAIQESKMDAGAPGEMRSAARELIESHIGELEIAAGIRPDHDCGRDIDYFEKHINKKDSFELQLLTQWYRFRTAHVKFQVSDDDAEKKACKQEMMQANDIMFVANSERFGWDYVPLALQTAADLDSLVLVQEKGKEGALESLRRSPFSATFSSKKLADRLLDPASLGVATSNQAELEGFQDIVDFLELAIKKGLEAAISRYPEMFSKSYLEEKCSSNEGLVDELDRMRETLAMFAFNRGQYERAALLERARIDWLHGEEAVPDGVNVGWRYLRAIFQALPAAERKTAMMRWFQSQGSTWFEDHPDRANDTLCDSCTRNLAGESVYLNGSYARCYACTERNIADWEKTGHSLDYFGDDAVERAINLSASELDATFRRSIVRQDAKVHARMT